MKTTRTADTVNAQDYFNTLDKPVVFWAGNGAPAGVLQINPEGDSLPFDLSELEGTVEDGTFEASNLTSGPGPYDWKFSDWNGSTIYKVQVLHDADSHDRLLLEWIAGDGCSRDEALQCALQYGLTAERFAELWD